MDIDPKKLYAVISGDFIGFSNLPLKNRRAMYFILKSGSKELAEAFPGILPLDVDMFRGDGWQMLLTDPVLSLRAGLYFRAYIRSQTPRKKIDTRMAIAVGRIDYIPENKVSAGDGTAFRMSGRLLEKINRIKSPTIRFAMENAKISRLLHPIVRQAGELSGQWTSSQARVIMDVLRRWPHDQTSATGLKRSPAKAMGQRIGQADWPEIQHALSVYENTLYAAI
jgi:hypothetical protein